MLTQLEEEKNNESEKDESSEKMYNSPFQNLSLKMKIDENAQDGSSNKVRTFLVYYFQKISLSEELKHPEPQIPEISNFMEKSMEEKESGEKPKNIEDPLMQTDELIDLYSADPVTGRAKDEEEGEDSNKIEGKQV